MDEDEELGEEKRMKEVREEDTEEEEERQNKNRRRKRRRRPTGGRAEGRKWAAETRAMSWFVTATREGGGEGRKEGKKKRATCRTTVIGFSLEPLNPE